VLHFGVEFANLTFDVFFKYDIITRRIVIVLEEPMIKLFACGTVMHMPNVSPTKVEQVDTLTRGGHLDRRQSPIVYRLMSLPREQRRVAFEAIMRGARGLSR